jgi:hypothetical protein
MYNNPYFSGAYNPQQTRERIDNQIMQLQQMKDQLPQAAGQPAINQTFQLAPNNNGLIKYVNSIDDVAKEMVIGDTPFFSKDLSVLWIKNIKGEIKAYTLNEIVQKDEKDLLIESLQLQLNEMKGMIEDAKSIYANVDESVEDEKSTNRTAIRAAKKK